MQNNLMTLYFNQGKLKFSSGHFTIFSATQRETMHGHNYSLEVRMVAKIGEPGIVEDYRVLEETVYALCQQLNWYCLIPTQSPYVTVEEDGEHYQITFNNKSMWLLKTDVVLMPLQNITLETLSQWFTTQLMENKSFIEKHHIQSVAVKVFNGPHHAAEACC